MLGQRHVLVIALLLALPASARASDFWDEVRTPSLHTYREHLSRARAALQEGRAEAALAQADAAIGVLSGRSAAHVARALALGRLQRPQPAVDAIREALRLDPEALDAAEPGGEAARLALRSGHAELAARILRRVVGKLPEGPQRRTLLILQAEACMAQGRRELAQALFLFRSAMRGDAVAHARAAIGLALGLHRQGEVDQAHVMAAKAAAHTRLFRDLDASALPLGERAARKALALEAIGDAQAAADAWRRAAEGKGPWQAHAQEQQR